MINLFKKFGGLKYFTILVAGILIRFLPLKAPNIEPVMASTMPLAKKYGRLSAFTFAFLSMILFDLIDGEVGAWTWVTAIVYGTIGIAASYYFKNKSNRPLNYLKFSIVRRPNRTHYRPNFLWSIFYGSAGWSNPLHRYPLARQQHLGASAEPRHLLLVRNETKSQSKNLRLPSQPKPKLNFTPESH